jgi:sodium/proline symporter
MAILGLSARSLITEINSGEQIFYIMAENLLPPILAGIVIASILSAVMSTVDSLLLASSSAISHDLQLYKFFKLDKLIISRIVMTAIVCLSTILAWMIPDSIFNRVLFAWSALGAAFGAIVIARVFGFEPSYKARIWSILTGFFTTVIFYTFGNIKPGTSDNSIYESLSYLGNLPGDPFERLVPFILSCFVIFLYSKKSV